MPNRIIKESICTSEKLSNLTDFEFRLWVCLITQADDAGRGDARPAIIKGHAFPLRERVTVKDIENGLHGLAAKGCVALYTVGGRPYFWFPTWGNHQRIRDCKPKYPGPEECDEEQQDLTSCGELRQVAACCGLNTIQSNTNPNPNTNPNLCAEQGSTPAISLVLNTGDMFPVFKSDIDAWVKLYPNVDVMQQLRAMAGWLDANPKKRKTKQGIKKFINGWLSREQDSGRSAPQSNRTLGLNQRGAENVSEMARYIQSMRDRRQE